MLCSLDNDDDRSSVRYDAIKLGNVKVRQLVDAPPF